MGVVEEGLNGLETDWYGLETAGVNSVGVKNGVDTPSMWYGVETGGVLEWSGPGSSEVE